MHHITFWISQTIVKISLSSTRYRDKPWLNTPHIHMNSDPKKIPTHGSSFSTLSTPSIFFLARLLIGASFQLNRVWKYKAIIWFDDQGVFLKNPQNSSSNLDPVPQKIVNRLPSSARNSTSRVGIQDVIICCSKV
jgi:hypothetical protein